MKTPMQRSWIVIAYTLPSEPSRMRAYAWRQLKQLGALNLHQAFWLLPRTEGLESAIKAVVAKVDEFGGQATVLEAGGSDEEWETRTVERFSAARNEEYAELVENIERFEFEVARETAAQKFTFAELEDVESDMEKIVKWHDRIAKRDYFAASGGDEARSRLEEARQKLEAFTCRVFERERPILAKDEANL